MQSARLNVFQRLFRSWESAHPYNACQVLRAAGRVDANAACQAWLDALRALQLGSVQLERNVCIHIAASADEAQRCFQRLADDTCLDQHLAAEMNRPFCDQRGVPFRAFLLPQGDSHWIGVVYRHWVADGASIRRLMQEWFVRLHDPERRCDRPARHPQSGYWRMFADQGGGMRTDEAAWNVLRTHDRFRRVCKPSELGSFSAEVRVRSRTAVEDLINPLRDACRSTGSRVSDVILAALVEACNQHVRLQARGFRRDIAVGSVIDLRRHTRAGSCDDAFGLFLGFTSVVCRPEEVRDWPRLLAAVARQTALHRRHGMARAATAWMPLALTISRLVPPGKIYHFYRKEMPIAGGLSNLPMDDTWAARYSPHLLIDYLRVSPTGPTSPVALATTTLGGRLYLALSYRCALLSDHGADGLLTSFLDRLHKVAACGSRDFASRR